MKLPPLQGGVMRVNRNDRRIDTTLGDLIATISDVAFEHSHDAKEAYELTRLVLLEILKTASFGRVIADPLFTANKFVH
jgi:hypothetical protein